VARHDGERVSNGCKIAGLLARCEGAIRIIIGFFLFGPISEGSRRTVSQTVTSRVNFPRQSRICSRYYDV
jgi:hypothetical protein